MHGMKSWLMNIWLLKHQLPLTLSSSLSSPKPVDFAKPGDLSHFLFSEAAITIFILLVDILLQNYIGELEWDHLLYISRGVL